MRSAPFLTAMQRRSEPEDQFDADESVLVVKDLVHVVDEYVELVGIAPLGEAWVIVTGHDGDRKQRLLLVEHVTDCGVTSGVQALGDDIRWLCQPKSNPPGLSKPDPLRAKRGVTGNLTGTHLHRCCGHPLEE